MIIYKNLCKRCKRVSYERAKILLIVLLTFSLTYQYCIRKCLDASMIYLKKIVLVSNTTNWTTLETLGTLGGLQGTLQHSWTTKEIRLVRYSIYVGYVIVHPIIGVLSDIHGGKFFLTTGLLLDALLCIAFPYIIQIFPWWASAFALFSFGAAECMVLTPIYCFLGYWITKYEITNLSSAVNCGSFFGIIITMYAVCDNVDVEPWYLLQKIFSSAGIILYLCMLFNTFSSPWLHPLLRRRSKARVEIIAGNKFPERVPWKVIVKDEGVQSVWFGIVSHKWIFFQLLFHFHIFRVRNIDDIITWVVKVPYVFGVIGVLSSGFLAKKVIGTNKIPMVYVRLVTNFGGTVICSLAANAASNITHTYIFIGTYSLSLFFMGMGFAGSSVNVHDLTRHYSGTVIGIANSVTALLQLMYILTKPGSHYQSRDEQWRKELRLSFFVCLASTMLCSMWIHTKKASWDIIIEEEEEFEEYY